MLPKRRNSQSFYAKKPVVIWQRTASLIVIAASQLGFRTHVYAPDANNSPAGDIAHERTGALYEPCGTALFARSVACYSEFENVQQVCMTILAQHCVASPGKLPSHGSAPLHEKSLVVPGIKHPVLHITTHFVEKTNVRARR